MHIFLYSKLYYAFASVNDFGEFKSYAHIVKQIAILKAKYYGECETFFLSVTYVKFLIRFNGLLLNRGLSISV